MAGGMLRQWQVNCSPEAQLGCGCVARPTGRCGHCAANTWISLTLVGKYNGATRAKNIVPKVFMLSGGYRDAKSDGLQIPPT